MDTHLFESQLADHKVKAHMHIGKADILLKVVYVLDIVRLWNETVHNISTVTSVVVRSCVTNVATASCSHPKKNWKHL